MRKLGARRRRKKPGGRILVSCNQSWYCRLPGGLSEISRGLRRTAEQGDDTPGSRRGNRDPGRVAAVLASRRNAMNFLLLPGELLL